MPALLLAWLFSIFGHILGSQMQTYALYSFFPVSQLIAEALDPISQPKGKVKYIHRDHEATLLTSRIKEQTAELF